MRIARAVRQSHQDGRCQMELSYETRRALRLNVGPVAAAVFDVLAHHDTGDGTGVEMTTGRLAAEANVSSKTVQRAVSQLVKARWVECRTRFQNNRQVANRYHLNPVNGGGHRDHPGGQIDQAIVTTSPIEEVVPDSSVVVSSNQSVVLPGELTQGSTREGLRPSVADTPAQEHADVPDEAGLVETVPATVRDRWPPRNSPMPMPRSHSGGGKNYLDIIRNAEWLVTYFEGYVVDQPTRERTAKGQKPIIDIPEWRKERWFGNAMTVVSEHPLCKVVEVVDWVFNDRFGYLPASVVEESDWATEGKLTHIRYVQKNFDLLVEEMHSGAQPDEGYEPTVAPPTSINYGKPFADPDAEAMVTELVELFTRFRHAVAPTVGIHHTRSWRWAKSFRIMIHYRGYDVEDLKMVITALIDHPEMDRTRYSDAYDLGRPGEWEHLVSAARLATMKAAERRPAAKRERDEREAVANWHHVNRLLEADDEDEPRSLDIANRRRRPMSYYQSGLGKPPESDLL